MRLSHKLFAAFLATSFMIVALMVAIMGFHVEHGFMEHMNQAEAEKLEELAGTLGAEYQAHQGWSTLQGNPRRWSKLIEPMDVGFPFDGPPPPPEEAGGLHGPKPTSPTEPPADAPHSRNEHGEFGPPMPPPHDPLRVLPWLSLFDAENHLIAGKNVTPTPGQFLLRDITAKGTRVGFLALRKHPRSSPSVNRFLRQQYEAFYLTGGSILLVAAIVSFLVARHILAPIRTLVAGTKALAALEFSTRVPVSTGDELGQLASDFNVMAQTLEKYERMRKQWVTDISHELRTPLAILRGEIEAIQDGVRPVTPQAIGSLHAEILHIGTIVDDLHQLSLADSGALQVEREPVDPLRVLEDTLVQFETRFRTTGIEIQAQLQEDGKPLVLSGSPDRIKRLYSNLLENTLQHSYAPGVLRVRRERTEDHLILTFEDSGPGVPPEALDRLFDRLYRVDSSRSRGRGGSGLGLAICKEIVESHGGTLSAANATSGGLRIEVRFPAGQADGAADEGATP